MRYMFLAALIACRENKVMNDSGSILIEDQDADLDGFLAAEDCDDDNAEINPGAEEVCDEIDNNCDGVVDENLTQLLYADRDRDGYGNPEESIDACELSDGWVQDDSDCDDSNSHSNPEAEEVCDGFDNNCDGDIDEGIVFDYYVDSDGDGFGSDDQMVSSCSAAPGLSTMGGDCDDDNIEISPLALEVCDEIDNNCDGVVDENLTQLFYADQDQDGYGNPEESIDACTQPAGYVENNEDCSDVDTQINPGVDELCDFQDNNCDGVIDEDSAIDASTWYQDADQDGYGNLNSPTQSCTVPTGYVTDSSDCDDVDNSQYPGATELCNGEDDNCDTVIDEDSAIDASTWYQDADQDGYGESASSLQSCIAPTGYVSGAGDCDDVDNAQYPGATELCNGEDDSCDGVIDEDSAIDASTWYQDVDQDGYGDDASSLQSCTAPTGYVTDSSDCDDVDNAQYPGATELCNGEDDNCDGVIDEDSAIDASTWYQDADQDGYGNLNSPTQSCTQPTGYVSDATDCNDTNSSISPAADDICDEVDNNCDGIEDNDVNYLGADSDCPIVDCGDVPSNFGDGHYWIDPDGAGAFEAYCELSATDGPWTWLYYSNLIAYWDFNGSNLSLDRISGFSGSYTASSSSNTPHSGLGNSILFDNNSNTRIDLGSGPIIGSQGSISWWSYSTSCSNNQIPFMFANQQGWIGDHLYPGRWHDDSQGSVFLNTSYSTCGNSSWQHNLYAYNASGVRVFVNGVEISNQAGAVAPEPSNQVLHIGSRPGFGTNGLEGNMDDVFFSTEVLGQADAQRLYNHGLQGRSLRWK